MNNRIKELRAKHNITQEELAKTIGVRRETIVFIEAGKHNPSLQLAHKIACELDETIEYTFKLEKQ